MGIWKGQYRQMSNSEKKQETLNQVWTDFENAKNYQHSLGLNEKIPKFVKFYEGDQWPEPTKKTKKLPRPTFNIVEMIIDNKVSNVLGSPINLNT
jgi:hypothetical protein